MISKWQMVNRDKTKAVCRLTIDPMMLMKKLFPFLLFIMLLSASASLPSAQQMQEDEISISLKGTDGRVYDISKMRGNVLLVSFGATWCQPCKEELRALEQLKQEYTDKPVRFLWVDIESPEDVSDGQLRNFAKSLKLTFPVLRDPTKFTFAQFTDTVRIPMVTIFNKEGRLVVRQTGMAAPEEYKTFIRARLNKFLATGERARSVGTN
jgi:thiol-disulfide isomerase/thioredoxin